MSFMKAIPNQTKIGWIGTGVMGRWMCEHLMKKGYQASVYTRSKEKAKPLLENGAIWAETPRDLAKNSNVIFTMLGFPKDVREVFFGENGIIAHTRPGTILIDLTTSNPSLSREIAQLAKKKHIGSLDAPVSGGDIGAKEARLSIMVGGEKEVFDAALPLLETMGSTVVYQGESGAGQHTKMINQILIATNMIGVCEALLYGYKAGLDPNTVLASVGKGAAASWSLSNLAPRMIERNFAPGFFVEHFIKDMGIALEEAKQMKLSLPGLALAHQLYLAVSAQGFEKKGTHALLLALEHLSGIKRT